MLGYVIKSFLSNYQISVNELADLAGLSAVYIQQLNRSQKNNPSIDTINKLATAVNVPIDYFLSLMALANQKHRELSKLDIQEPELERTINLYLSQDITLHTIREFEENKTLPEAFYKKKARTKQTKP